MRISDWSSDVCSSDLIHIDGVPLHIVDTAGLRDTDDTVESIGIARTWKEIERADVILHLQDATQPVDALDAQIVARLPARTPLLTVFNKTDLLDRPFQAAAGHLGISARTGAGDRKSGVKGTRVAERVDTGGRR